MITLLTGLDTYMHRQYIHALSDAEVLDAEKLELHNLADIFMGATLFGGDRTVVVRDATGNKALWDALPAYIERGSDTHIVLVAPQIDKRSAAWRALKKHAAIEEFTPLDERDIAGAVTFVQSISDLDNALARQVAERAGTDKWALKTAVDKLSALPTITKDDIDIHIHADSRAHVFDLLMHACRGRADKVTDDLHALRGSEDAYKVWGLLCTQLFQLSAASESIKTGGNLAKDFGMHPYVAKKTQELAQVVNIATVHACIKEWALADEKLKTTGVDPWMIVEMALLRLARAVR